MLQEFKNVRQFDDEYRRFFRDANFDLYVFYEYNGSCISGFQLMYDKDSLPGVLSWNIESGFHQYKIDDGDGGIYDMAPILIPDNGHDVSNLLNRFSANAKAVDKDVFDTVFSRCMDFINRESQCKASVGNGIQ